MHEEGRGFNEARIFVLMGVLHQVGNDLKRVWCWICLCGRYCLYAWCFGISLNIICISFPGSLAAIKVTCIFFHVCLLSKNVYFGGVDKNHISWRV